MFFTEVFKFFVGVTLGEEARRVPVPNVFRAGFDKTIGNLTTYRSRTITRHGHSYLRGSGMKGLGLKGF